jgi:hypothetical protein
MALVPWTPKAANVFKSAWIPAPPPLSEPAIVNATGKVLRVVMFGSAPEFRRAAPPCKAPAP